MCDCLPINHKAIYFSLVSKLCFSGILKAFSHKKSRTDSKGLASIMINRIVMKGSLLSWHCTWKNNTD